MIEKIKTGGNGEKSKKPNGCSDRGGGDGARRKRRRAGGKTLSLCPRSAAQYRLQRRLRYLFRQAQGIEQRHHADRPVSGRAARAGAAAAATGQVGRPRICDRIIAEYLDDLPARRRDVVDSSV